MLLSSLKRSWHQLTSRRIYIAAIVVVPMLFTWFMLDLMREGLPLKVPVAMVDLDNSSLSRKVTRELSAEELLDVTCHLSSYAEAKRLIKQGKIYGFFLIPNDFQQKAIGGRGPEISFYSNLAVFVPGTLSYKGFMTTSVSTSGGLARTTLVSSGISDATADTLLQPVVFEINPLSNPWTNYSIYLSNSFIPCLLALMVLLVTAFSITSEIKNGTAPEWLASAGGSVYTAVTAKLLPQTIIFTLVGWAMQAIFFHVCDFPLNNHAAHMLAAMFMMVVASQAFALFVVCLIPNMRLSLSICSLLGILSFSIAGFSFPVEQMYPAIGIFSYFLPIRYYFLIYIDQALNGIPIYYSRIYYACLAAFLLLPFTALWKLRRHLINPVYVP